MRLPACPGRLVPWLVRHAGHEVPYTESFWSASGCMPSTPTWTSSTGLPPSAGRSSVVVVCSGMAPKFSDLAYTRRRLIDSALTAISSNHASISALPASPMSDASLSTCLKRSWRISAGGNLLSTDPKTSEEDWSRLHQLHQLPAIGPQASPHTKDAQAPRCRPRRGPEQVVRKPAPCCARPGPGA